VFFVALYVVLASQMLFLHTLMKDGKSLSIAPIKDANAATIPQIILPTPTNTPTPSPTPSPTPVPVGDPISIRVPKIQVDTGFVQVAITPENIMETPTNFAEVGWYTKAPRPGEKGAAIVNGHYDDARGKPAVFYNLSKLIQGDEIIVTTSLGQELTFVVESSYSEGYTSFPKELVYAPYDGKGLRLITCDGAWNALEKTYSKRLVVTAKLKG